MNGHVVFEDGYNPVFLLLPVAPIVYQATFFVVKGVRATDAALDGMCAQCEPLNTQTGKVNLKYLTRFAL